MLKNTEKHLRLATLHHLDFTNPITRPWGDLVEAVKSSSTISRQRTTVQKPDMSKEEHIEEAKNLILEYLDDNGFRMMSFERIRENIDDQYNNDFLAEVIARNKHIFRKAKLRGNKPGVKKISSANQ